jgi:hypothetical protein
MHLGELPPPQPPQDITGRIRRTKHNLEDMLVMVAPFWVFHKPRTRLDTKIIDWKMMRLSTTDAQRPACGLPLAAAPSLGY